VHRELAGLHAQPLKALRDELPGYLGTPLAPAPPPTAI
jgi:hypothetical protein